MYVCVVEESGIVNEVVYIFHRKFNDSFFIKR